MEVEAGNPSGGSRRGADGTRSGLTRHDPRTRALERSARHCPCSDIYYVVLYLIKYCIRAGAPGAATGVGRKRPG
jgi:hypothetical protein